VVELLLAKGAADSAHKRNRRGFLPRELGTDANPVRRFIQMVLGGRARPEAPSNEEMATPKLGGIRALGSASAKPQRTATTGGSSRSTRTRASLGADKRINSKQTSIVA